MQGEGGVRPLTPAFAAAINEACAQTGALLIADEVQSGLGRTGYPFYFAALGLQAASGVGRQGARRRRAGRRGARQRGGRRHDLVRRSRQHLRRQPARVPRGARASSTSWSAAGCSRTSAASARTSSSGCARSRAKHPIVKEVRGAGLMWGLELTRDAAPVVPAGARARRRRQPHGGDGRAAAAAAHHHRSRDRRGARSARCGARRRGSWRMKQPTRGRITLRTGERVGRAASSTR